MKRLGTPGQGDLLHLKETRRDDPNNNLRTSFRITPELKKALTLRLLDEGYGIKGKSRWITEAIQSMIADPRYTATNIYKAQILELARTRQPDASDVANLPHPVWIHAWHAMLDTMKYGATLDPPEYAEVTLSDVLHTAILNRLSCTAHTAP
jgi:hypothetical protein